MLNYLKKKRLTNIVESHARPGMRSMRGSAGMGALRVGKGEGSIEAGLAASTIVSLLRSSSEA